MKQFSPPVYDTGTLHNTLQGVLHPGTPTTIEHRFREYGIYVANGTGWGYRKGNSGKDDENGLQFMRGGKYNYGETYQGLLSDALAAMFGDPTQAADNNNGNLGATLTIGNI